MPLRVLIIPDKFKGIGIGGSATNDGGFGVARALGWQFLDQSGQSIDHWTALNRLKQISAPQRRRWFDTDGQRRKPSRPALPQAPWLSRSLEWYKHPLPG
jgi:hypothetical protein